MKRNMIMQSKQTTHHLANKLRTKTLVIQCGKARMLNFEPYQHLLGLFDEILSFGFVRIIKLVFQCTGLFSLFLGHLCCIFSIITGLLNLCSI